MLSHGQAKGKGRSFEQPRSDFGTGKLSSKPFKPRYKEPAPSMVPVERMHSAQARIRALQEENRELHLRVDSLEADLTRERQYTEAMMSAFRQQATLATVWPAVPTPQSHPTAAAVAAPATVGPTIPGPAVEWRLVPTASGAGAGAGISPFQ